MVQTKLFFIRNKNIIYILLLLCLIILIYSFFPSEDKTYDVWKIFAGIFQNISDSKFPPNINHFFLTLFFVVVPVLIIFSISSLLYPMKPWEILEKIGRKRKNTATFSYLLLKKNVKDFIKTIETLEHGVKVLKEDVNELQNLILPEVSKNDIYTTSLLEPDEIYADPDLINSVNSNLSYAHNNNTNLVRILVTDHFNQLMADKDKNGTSINKLVKLHRTNNAAFYIISEDDYKTCWSKYGLKEDYLDFLLIDRQVVFGLKNSKTDYKTLRDGEYFILFVKDSADDIANYKKMINQVILLAKKVS